MDTSAIAETYIRYIQYADGGAREFRLEIRGVSRRTLVAVHPDGTETPHGGEELIMADDMTAHAEYWACHYGPLMEAAGFYKE